MLSKETCSHPGWARCFELQQQAASWHPCRCLLTLQPIFEVLPQLSNALKGWVRPHQSGRLRCCPMCCRITAHCRARPLCLCRRRCCNCLGSRCCRCRLGHHGAAAVHVLRDEAQRRCVLPGVGMLHAGVPQQPRTVLLQPVPGQVGVALVCCRRSQGLLHGHGRPADQVRVSTHLGSQLVHLAASRRRAQGR